MFTEMIPPLRPVLLVLDGHGSHITIDVIEYARSKEIHLLCLPSHTSHILQPLDVGVFKSFKSFFSKACRQYMAKNPGRVITKDILATVAGDAFAQSHTPLNILGGFKKSGIYPFNPGQVSDRQLAPSKALVKPSPQPPTFSPEQIELFEQRYAEGYDVPDPTYLAWKSVNYPSPESVVSTTTAISSPGSSASAIAGTCTCMSTVHTATSPSITSSVSSSSVKTNQSSEEVLSDLLTLPQPPPPKTSQRKKAVNHKATEITDPAVLQELKDKQLPAAEAKKEKEEKKLERERKANERKLEERKKLEREKKALEKAKTKERKAQESRGKKRKPRSTCTRRATSPTTDDLDSLFSQLEIDEDSEDNGQCSNCGMCFGDEQDEDKFWVCCDKCNMWFCFHCHNFTTKDTVPDEFYCLKCV